MPQNSKCRTALLLSNDAREISLLREILGTYVTVVNAGNLKEIVSLLTADTYGALLCDWCFEGGSWRDAVLLLRDYDPSLPLIVLSPAGGEYEWLEALDDGAFDLLAAPWSKLTLFGALEHAFASRDARLLRGTHQRPQETEPKLLSSV